MTPDPHKPGTPSKGCDPHPTKVLGILPVSSVEQDLTLY